MQPNSPLTEDRLAEIRAEFDALLAGITGARILIANGAPITVVDDELRKAYLLAKECGPIFAEVQRLRAELALEKGHYNAARQRFENLYTDAMIAHCWFAKHFGEIMNGRDFAVKCEMAERLQAESSGGGTK